MPPSLDLDVLRSFVEGVELRSFAKAADRVGRSTSAVSAQLKKLEARVGAPIMRKSGRGLVLTPTGEVLLGYARRLLALNDEAVAAVRSVDLRGEVRLGLQEDFGEALLAAVLGGFARAHPRVRVEVTLSRNADLLSQIELGRLDLALAWDAAGGAGQPLAIREVPMRWIGPAERGDADLVVRALAHRQPIPLVALEAPCLMRSAATAALERAGIPWRLAFTSSSLSGIWSAVGAGLGVTVRTPIGLPAHLSTLDSLPPLPTLGLRLHRGERRPEAAVDRLERIILDHLDGLVPPSAFTEPPRPGRPPAARRTRAARPDALRPEPRRRGGSDGPA